MLPLCKILNILLLTALCVVNNSVARDYSVRTTSTGKVKGLVERYKHQNIEKFLGIPYASAPVGKLRFEVSDAELAHQENMSV